MTSSPWWAPHVHADRRPFLRARGAITTATRAWFAARDFAEVETAILQVSPGNEAHLHAFATELIAPDATRHPLYLHTSPEFAAKKLLAAGEPRLFTFARVFRNRERRPLHHPEFTMLEWYRANEPYGVLIADCAALLAAAADAAGTRRFAFRGREADPFASAGAARPSRRPSPAMPASICCAALELTAGAAAAKRQGIRVAADDTWADVFSRVLVERIEPNLGIGRATILDDIRSARPRSRDRPRTTSASPSASSFTSAASRSRTRSASSPTRPSSAAVSSPRWPRQRVHGERYPVDEDFLAALGQMPPARASRSASTGW